MNLRAQSQDSVFLSGGIPPRCHTRRALCDGRNGARAVYPGHHGKYHRRGRARGRHQLHAVALKQVKRVGTLGVTQLEHDIAIDKGLYYYQGNDFASEIVFSIRRLTEPGKEHVDNHFSPLSEVQKEDFGKMTDEIVSFLNRSSAMIESNDYHRMDDLIAESVDLTAKLTLLKKEELKRIQGQSGSTKVSMVYLNMVQEAQNVVSFTANLLKVSRKFQKE